MTSLLVSFQVMFILHLFVYLLVCLHLSLPKCGGQRTTAEVSSLPTLRAPQLSGLVAGVFPHMYGYHTLWIRLQATMWVLEIEAWSFARTSVLNC